MCMDYAKKCKCGARTASFNFKDSLLPGEVISELYCPECSSGVQHDSQTMMRDNGWVLHFEMDMARFMLNKLPLPASGITPEYLFDEGYCSWRGVTPTDHIDSLREREEILKYAKTDPKRYFEELKNWGNKRMERLAREGWRKARDGQPVHS
jgi:hypothetical protein